MEEAKDRGFGPADMQEFLALLDTARMLSLQMARLSNNIDDL
jgi:hypothetical protein